MAFNMGTLSRIVLILTGVMTFVSVVWVTSHIRPTAPVPDVVLTLIDEHGEALDVWREYSLNHKLQGAYLVHIDGHADMGVPVSMPRPDSQEAMDTITIEAQNDDFILRAIAMKLVSAMIWVKPDWLLEADGLYDADKLLPNGDRVWVGEELCFGFRGGNDDDDGGAHLPACECLEEYRTMADGTIEVQDMTCDSGDDDDVPVDECDCFISAFTNTITSGFVPVFGLTRPEDDHRPIILDIDEDFFMVSDPVDQVKSNGWDDVTLRDVDEPLRAFCVDDPSQEEALAKLLVDIVSSGEVQVPEDFDILLCDDDATQEEFETQLLEFSDAVQDSLDQTDNSQDRFQKAKALLVVGFGALAGTPDWPKPFAITLGVDNAAPHIDDDHTYKTNNLVEYYEPTPERLERQMALMRNWLGRANIAHRVRLITLCRSVRDGYLPRAHHAVVETGVIKMLSELFPNARIDPSRARLHW